MGKRGPKPTPTKTLERRGSSLVYQRKGEVVTKAERPRCPDWLKDPIAKKIWKKKVHELFDLGLMSKLDVEMLAMYCDAFAEYIKIRHEIQGNIIKTTNGNYIQHPAIAVRNKLFTLVMKAAAELGLSPSARVGLEPSKVSGNKKGEDRFFKPKLSKKTAG